MPGLITVVLIAGTLLILTIVFVALASRYKRCPSDMILVVYGKVGEGVSARCIHGGAAFILPLLQDCSFMSLMPMTINIPLQNALSFQNIRIHVPSTFTIAISSRPETMINAAERLLGLNQTEIEDMAREIIFGQLRLTVASLTIEDINKDREKFLSAIRHNVEPELNKIGLFLINVNITDITDESDYIESIGKKAAAEAVNRARVDVAQQEKIGAIGQAEAARERSIKVAQNEAESEKGQKQAEADRRIYVQQQETKAAIGEADAEREKAIRIAENNAQAEKGRKKAEADRRIFVQSQEAEAIGGENKSKAEIADANAELQIKQADAFKRGEVAKRQAQVEIQKAQYTAEQQRLTAEEIASAEVEKRRIEIAAEATAEKTRLEARGEADAVLLKYEAEAKGIRQVLDGKAAGYAELIKSCGGNEKGAATLLMVEKIEEIVKHQAEAIRNLKIDKITVWDSGNSANGNSTTANFVSGMIKSLPPLQDIAQMAGIELPSYLGKIVEDESGESRPSGAGESGGTSENGPQT